VQLEDPENLLTLLLLLPLLYYDMATTIMDQKKKAKEISVP
jgi:hypothetical protein